jgi:hypothetical protein
MKPNDSEANRPDSHYSDLVDEGRERVNAHDPTNAWGERVVEGEGTYPGPEALADAAPEAETDNPNSAHGGDGHEGDWPGLE